MSDTSVSKGSGALPAQTLLQLIDAGFIKNVKPDQVRASSLDLSLSDEVYQVEGIFQPRQGETVRDVLNSIKKKKHDLAKPLQKDQMYLARLNETFTLPRNIYGICNPKSTSGRLDVHVRLLADQVARYDVLKPVGWSGEVWVSIVPKSFSVLAHPNLSLNQLRLFTKDTRLNDLELEIEFNKSRLLWRQYEAKPYSYEDIRVRDDDGSLILTLDLENEVLGYVAKDTDKVIDLAKVGSHPWRQFFKPVRQKGDYVYLERNKFYILSTHEAVCIPPHLACEMVGMDERSGEFRSHYAGFIDPGWGWGKEGEISDTEKGRPLTLEVRPFEDIIVRQGQPIAKITFEYLTEIPDTHYDTLDSNYTVQKGPKLAKQFKM